MALHTRSEVDVLVVGGGTAGIIAAIGAARSGARTLVVEQNSFVGGTASTGAQPVIGFHNNRGNQIVGGIAWEFITRLIRMGEAAEISPVTETERPWEHSVGYTSHKVPMRPEAVKHLLLEMLCESNVELLLQTFFLDVVMEGNRIAGVEVANKSGRMVLSTKIVIDCSGDGDVAVRAGAPFEKGRPTDGAMQPVTPMFVLAGVDLDRAKDADIFVEGTAVVGGGASPEWRQRYRRGSVQLGDWADELREQLPGYKGAGFTLKDWGNGVYYCGNGMHFTRVDASQADDLTAVQVRLGLYMYRLVQYLRVHAPGFEDCHLVHTFPIGIRETRRILGDYYLTMEDVLTARRHSDDIALCGYFIDIHNYDGWRLHIPHEGTQVSGGGAYGIPYGCLVPREVEGLLLAGRHLSASHEAQASARVIGPCMAMGHAAGTAAALAAEQGLAPRELDVSYLQETLHQQDAILR